MPRWFNTAGPCQSAKHYMLPPAARLPRMQRLIEQEGYFIIHAPRQIGKTTAMLALAHELTNSGKYTAIMVSAEVGAAFPKDIDKAEKAILSAWQQAARIRLPANLQPPSWPAAPAGSQINRALQEWTITSPRPLVVFIDEIDALQDEVLIGVLRQLRDGYPNRPQGFPQSLALVGLRDVRDYKVASGGSDRLHTASPFNIKVESLTLRNFTREEVGELYAQHTHDTDQIFSDTAVDRAFYLTQGQPWLVNALARQIVEVIAPDPTINITVEHFDQAKENLIRRQDTHLDSLAERLRDSRIRQIVEPILSGQALGDIPLDDRRFALDLGLLRRDPAGGLTIANPIYREVIPRVLASGPQDSLPIIQPSWLQSDGTLDIDKLLDAFLQFWRQHGEPLLRSAPYHEIAPHLVLMAFLHRVVNGGGTLDREYAIGTDRMDLCLRYGSVILAMELKVWRDGRPDPLNAGLEQLDRYLAGLGLDQGWLVIFDKRDQIPSIAERTMTASAQTPKGKKITVIRG
ncbi:AAA-like domain-containing protein [Leptothoe spongobia]|uniref:AAA-like domain-containing protein n=1 Tax=Leptothoe spongobia TAU-MAC 1115 TaxID=1967444 RepID=A0A947DAR8_9CYAN|nr:AAA-like domain-containing protein [Leptothoe spongobia TAU-MAC 1115]